MASSLSSSSSSSSTIPRVKYDVFLSFRGEDTRHGFTSHLYTALCRKQVQTFMDDVRLKRGDEISPTLLKAIEESKIAVIIMSKDYASSGWCLDELVKILEWRKSNGQMVIPVFYNVNLLDVREQSGSFKDAFVKHEERFKEMPEKVQRFRSALTEVSDLPGWDSSITRPESKLVDEIVRDVSKKLDDLSPLSRNDGLVGLDSRIGQIKSLLCMELSDFRVVGIWGMGGIGKTTIAEAIFHQISRQFEGCCFIANVREESEKSGGLVRLREQVISKILDEIGNLKIATPNSIPLLIKQRLQRKKVFIVLDDVNDSEQLKILTGGLDRFGPGSRVIITTRDKQVLRDYQVEYIYEVERFKYHEALRFFCNYAFKQNHPCKSFVELSDSIIGYANGNPLALKVLGSSLYRKSRCDWESTLHKLKGIPNPKIQNVLRISYDGLDREEQEIFLDIACFFKGEDSDHVLKILDGCYFSAYIGLTILIDKSLVTIPSNKKLQMHDLLQEMGWEIVRKVSFKDPGKHSRLWNYEDICKVLKKNTGTNAIEGLFLDMSKIRDMNLSSEAFAKMQNLRFLKLYLSQSQSFGDNADIASKLHFPQGLKYLSDELRYLHWVGYPLKKLPSKFSPENLIELNLPYSKVEQLWRGNKHAKELKLIDLFNSRNLIEIPDVSESPNLEVIKLEDCTSLVKVPSSIHSLNHLSILQLTGCKSLGEFPSNIHFGSLKILNLASCSKLKSFPQISGSIRELNLGGTAIEEVPSSIASLTELDLLILTRCPRLKSISTSICKLKSLRRLFLEKCSKLESFPEIIEKMEHLEIICLNQATVIKELPYSIKNLSRLGRLRVRDCKNLEMIPSSIHNLTSLIEIDLSGCVKLNKLPPLSALCSLTAIFLSYCNLTEIPEDLCRISSLKTLNLDGNKIESLPAGIKQLSKLKRLFLRECKMLRSLPELPPRLRQVQATNCERLLSLPKLPSSIEELDASELEIVSKCYFPFSGINIQFYFTNCLKLNQTAYNTVFADSQLRIHNMAVKALRLCYEKVFKFTPLISLCLPRSEIPDWFSYQNSGSTLTIQLPQHLNKRMFIGFALCAVIAFEKGYCEPGFFISCDYHFDGNFADYLSCRLQVTNLSYDNIPMISDHVILGYDPCLDVRMLRGDYTTASFNFNLVEGGETYGKVKCCGVCPLYAQSKMYQPGTCIEKFNEAETSGSKCGRIYNEELEPDPKRIRRK